MFFACGDLCGGVWHASAGVVQVVWRMNVRSAARCAHARRSSNDTAHRSSIGTPEDAGAIADTESSIAGSRYSGTIVPQTGPGERRVTCVVCACALSWRGTGKAKEGGWRGRGRAQAGRASEGISPDLWLLLQALRGCTRKTHSGLAHRVWPLCNSNTDTHLHARMYLYYLRLVEDEQWCELGVNVFSE